MAEIAAAKRKLVKLKVIREKYVDTNEYAEEDKQILDDSNDCVLAEDIRIGKFWIHT